MAIMSAEENGVPATGSKPWIAPTSGFENQLVVLHLRVSAASTSVPMLGFGRASPVRLRRFRSTTVTRKLSRIEMLDIRRPLAVAAQRARPARVDGALSRS